MNFPEGVFDNFLSFSVVCVRWQTDNWCRQDKILGRENNQPSARFGEEHLIHVSEIDCIKLYCSVCGLSRFGCWDSTSLVFNLLFHSDLIFLNLILFKNWCARFEIISNSANDWQLDPSSECFYAFVDIRFPYVLTLNGYYIIANS